MSNLELLLIEDTPADAMLFMEQIQQQYGSDVQIIWKKNLAEAKLYLADNMVDQIWLDRVLPDFNIHNFATEVAALKKHLNSEDKNELYLLTASPPPNVQAQAKAAHVDIVSKDDLMPAGDSQILAMVTQLLAKRSSGATVRVETESRLVRMEVKLEHLIHTLGAIGELKNLVEQLRVETSLMREHVNQVPTLTSQVSELKKASTNRDNLEIKKLDMRQAIILAIITGIGTLAITWLTKMGGDSKLPSPPVSNPIESPKK